MPEHGRASKKRTAVRTKLAHWRLYRNVTQRQMAEATGITLSSYRRLERGQIANPPLRWLVNCQLALDLPDIEDVIDDQWATFKQFGDGPSEPPDPDYFFANQEEGSDDEQPG